MNGWLKVGAVAGVAAFVAGIGVLVWAAAAHQLHPNGQIGYGDIAVGVGTLILAVVTLASVVLGWQALRDNREEIAISRQEAEAAQRPVLMPFMDDKVRYTIHEWGSDVVARPHVNQADGNLLIPVRNVGAGVALDVSVMIAGRTDSFEWSELWGEHTYSGYEVAIAAGESGPVMANPPSISAVPTFELAITYRDLADTGWVTTARYRRSDDDDGGRGWFLTPRIYRIPDGASVTSFAREKLNNNPELYKALLPRTLEVVQIDPEDE